MGEPILLLETVGAKTGAKRATPLVYLREGDDVILIASRGGSPRHPSWYLNLKANPEAAVTLGGKTAKYTARETEGEERDALFAKAVESYPSYAVYQHRTEGRIIPVMALRAAES